MRKAIFAAAVLALGASGGVGYGLGQHADAASSFGKTFTVVQAPGTLIDEATHAAPDLSRPIPPGDSIVFEQALSQNGQRVGISKGTCTAVFGTQLLCNATFTIAGHGSLAIQAVVDLANPVGDYPILGGTGAFVNARGWGHFQALASGEEVHTFHLA